MVFKKISREEEERMAQVIMSRGNMPYGLLYGNNKKLMYHDLNTESDR